MNVPRFYFYFNGLYCIYLIYNNIRKQRNNINGFNGVFNSEKEYKMIVKCYKMEDKCITIIVEIEYRTMAVKLTEQEKKKKRLERETDKFMETVEEFLASKNGGEVPREWGASLLLLRSYYYQFITMNEEINNLDSLIQVGRYGPQPSPLLAARDKAAVRLESLMDKLGLTMKSSIKMNLSTPKEEDSPLQTFVKNKIELRD